VIAAKSPTSANGWQIPATGYVGHLLLDMWAAGVPLFCDPGAHLLCQRSVILITDNTSALCYYFREPTLAVFTYINYPR
jgi:hypothetical protein